MAGAGTLSVRDVDAVLGIVAEAEAAREKTPFGIDVIDRMATVLRADHAAYFEHGGRSEDDVWVSRHGPVYELPEDEVWDANRDWPLRDAANIGSKVAVAMSERLPTKRSRLRNAWYRTILEPCGHEDVLKVWLPAPSGTSRGFFFNRDRGRGLFDDRDHAVLTVLRPHLAGVRERWWQRERPRPYGLTHREAEVVQLLREGLTNQQIAERLVVSAGTVRTHLENVFAKLDVHTRTAAVARTFRGS